MRCYICLLYTSLANFGRRLFEQQLVGLESWMITGGSPRAKERYLTLLEENPELLQYVPLKHKMCIRDSGCINRKRDNSLRVISTLPAGSIPNGVSWWGIKGPIPVSYTHL